MPWPSKRSSGNKSFQTNPAVVKLIIASVVILSLVVLFIFALFPADISVSRLIQTDTPKDSVYARVANLTSWPGWNGLLPAGVALTDRTPDQLSYPDLGITVSRRTGDSVITRWVNSKGKSFTGSFRFGQEGVHTILQWSMQFHMKWYPWEKLSGMFYERRIGDVMDSSLLNLLKSPRQP